VLPHARHWEQINNNNDDDEDNDEQWRAGRSLRAAGKLHTASAMAGGRRCAIQSLLGHGSGRLSQRAAPRGQRCLGERP
jgi:hypothetical protein